MGVAFERTATPPRPAAEDAPVVLTTDEWDRVMTRPALARFWRSVLERALLATHDAPASDAAGQRADGESAEP
jgi:hypothetical protein